MLITKAALLTLISQQSGITYTNANTIFTETFIRVNEVFMKEYSIVVKNLENVTIYQCLGYKGYRNVMSYLPN